MKLEKDILINGEIKYKNGDVFNRSLNEGYEKMKYKNGNKYVGYIKNDQKEVEGSMNYNNGDNYKESWKNDKK